MSDQFFLYIALLLQSFLFSLAKDTYRITLSSIEYNVNEILYFLYTVQVYNLNQIFQLLFIFFYKFSFCLDKTIYQ